MQPGGGGKKKGFTLIELLAVIVILAVIALIATPIVLSILTKVRKSAFQDSAYGMMESAKAEYSEAILDGENMPTFFEYPFDNLKFTGMKPKGGMISIDKNGNIAIAIHNNEWCASKGFLEREVTLTEYRKETCIIRESENDPIITLNGDKTLYIGLNETYTELGAKASTRGGENLDYKIEIKENDEIVSSIDTSKETTYQIKYEASNNGKIVSIERTIVVLDMTPVIKMSEENETYVKEKDVLLNISGIRPNEVESFTYEIKKDGESTKIETVNGFTKTLTFNETGTYEVIVTVTDNNNHSNTLSKTYKIDATIPDVGSVTANGTMGSNNWYTSNVTFTLTDGTDSLSGHKSTTVTPSSITSNTSGTSVTVTTIDNAGNQATKTFGPYKVDKTAPTYTVKSTATVTILKGESNAITSYFNSPTWSISGTGTVTCKSGSTTVTNTSSLSIGTHTVICTATGKNGLSTSARKTIAVNGWIVASTSNHGSLGNVPSLNGLVAVKFSSQSDRTTKWYDYSTQMWANAVSVTSGYRNLSAGAEIPESAIKAYFVWIPRYEYRYTNLGTSYAGGSQAQPGGITINFIAKTKTSPSTNYKIHPAFTFGTTQLAGIWVGKFETTGSASVPTIKPNLSSLRNQNVSTQFQTSKKFSASGNSYGISTSADAHMMKNSEWGAVAYLSQSKYGKYGNSSYSGANKEIYYNSNGYITGYSSGTPFYEKVTYKYHGSPNGTGASTTGTIYGVYDMNGSASEYVMGVYNGSLGSASGFSSLPASKYYDNYTSRTDTTACNGGICYGHALSETKDWYHSSSSFWFPTTDYPWFVRSGRIKIFSYSSCMPSGGGGGALESTTFRCVLIG